MKNIHKKCKEISESEYNIYKLLDIERHEGARDSIITIAIHENGYSLKRHIKLLNQSVTSKNSILECSHLRIRKQGRDSMNLTLLDLKSPFSIRSRKTCLVVKVCIIVSNTWECYESTCIKIK